MSWNIEAQFFLFKYLYQLFGIVFDTGIAQTLPCLGLNNRIWIESQFFKLITYSFLLLLYFFLLLFVYNKEVLFSYVIHNLKRKTKSLSKVSIESQHCAGNFPRPLDSGVVNTRVKLSTFPPWKPFVLYISLLFTSLCVVPCTLYQPAVK